MKRWMAGLAVTMAAVSSAWAVPFNASDVAAEATWFAHLDVDRLKSTDVGKGILEQLTTEEADKKFAALQAVFNFDPRKDLSGLTVCGAGRKSYAVIRGRFDAERLVTLLRANDGYEEATAEGYAIHSWIDDGKAKKQGRDKARMYGAFHPGGAIVISDNAEVLGHALAVLDAKKPATAIRLPDTAGPAPFLVGTFTDLQGADPKNAALKMARSGTVILGEAAGRVKGRLALETADTETASNLQKVAEGMRSALLLNAAKDPRAADLALAAAVERTDATVTATLDLPASDVVKVIREEAAKKTAPAATE